MDRQEKRFAVLGANGYLGRHLAFHLHTAGHSITSYDLQPSGSLEAIPYRPLDVVDATAWKSIDTDIDAFFVFSGLTGTHQGFDDYARYLAINELGLLHLLDLLRRRDHKPRIVFPSSRLVYRGRPEPLTEEAPKESKTLYAANKLAAEGFLQAYHAAFGIPYTIFR
ncbi:MAG: NAD(P)-dependent oxidoreductase, partial [Verrucomicrobiota bacterium]|nr:NAD(P)-dependent oxidoreductase [Verrucomicrobiota bacterium]